MRRLHGSMDDDYKDGQEADREKQDEEEASSGTTAQSDRYYRLDRNYRPTTARLPLNLLVIPRATRYLAGT